MGSVAGRARVRWLIVLGLATGVAAPALAQTAGNVGATCDDDLLAPLPIVLTPSRLPQPQNEAPASMTVLDRELIRATGYRDIARLLRLVPGMQIGQERGNKDWVTYHGMGNDYPSWMQVLIDGRSVFSPGNFDGVDWSFLPVTIDEIERIEVVRGTDSVAYGSNAVLGVVNIITRHSADQLGNLAAVKLGNAGIRDVDVQIDAREGAGSLRVSVAEKRDDGFENLYDGRRVGMISLRGDYRLGEHDELMVRLGGSEGWRQLGYPDSVFGNNAERTADTATANLHLQWRHAPGPDEEWSLHYYRNQDQVEEAWLATAPPALGSVAVPLNRDRKSSRDSIELQHRFSWSERLRTVWGLEYRQDEVTAPFLYYSDPTQQDRLGRAFGQAEWWFDPRWGINASGLLEKFDDQPVRFSPRVFANWKLTPADTLRAGYARAWREPFVFERYGDVQVWYPGVGLLAQPYAPNPDLGSSRMDSVELGYLAQFRPGKTRFDARLFYERIEGFITRVSMPPAGVLPLPSARYENLTTPVVLRGLEYQFDSQPWPGGRILFSHTLIDRSSSNQTLTQLSSPYAASLSWMQSFGSHWSTTLTLLRMGPIAGGFGLGATVTYESQPSPTAAFRVAWTPLSGLELAVVGTNLGGAHQEIADRSEQALHPTTPMNETSPMVWLALSYRSH